MVGDSVGDFKQVELAQVDVRFLLVAAAPFQADVALVVPPCEKQSEKVLDLAQDGQIEQQVVLVLISSLL